MPKRFRILLLLTCFIFPALALAAGKTELTWYGHAAFKITTPNGKVLFIDLTTIVQKDLTPLTKFKGF
ncbi:MAG: metal-dependent hydrolase, partial [Gammaproteobacteria bacterium]